MKTDKNPDPNPMGALAPARLDCDRLEDRILYSASPLDPELLTGETEVVDLFEGDEDALAALDALLDMSPHPIDDFSKINLELLQVEVLVESEGYQAPTSDEGLELVFIDSSVENFEQLIADIESNDGLEIFLLDSAADGVEQISTV